MYQDKKNEYNTARKGSQILTNALTKNTNSLIKNTNALICALLCPKGEALRTSWNRSHQFMLVFPSWLPAANWKWSIGCISSDHLHSAAGVVPQPLLNTTAMWLPDCPTLTMNLGPHEKASKWWVREDHWISFPQTLLHGMLSEATTRSNNDVVTFGFRAIFLWLKQPWKHLTDQISACLDTLEGKGPMSPQRVPVTCQMLPHGGLLTPSDINKDT